MAEDLWGSGSASSNSKTNSNSNSKTKPHTKKSHSKTHNNAILKNNIDPQSNTYDDSQSITLREGWLQMSTTSMGDRGSGFSTPMRRHCVLTPLFLMIMKKKGNRCIDRIALDAILDVNAPVLGNQSMFKIATVEQTGVEQRKGGLNMFVCASSRLRNEWMYAIQTAIQERKKNVGKRRHVKQGAVKNWSTLRGVVQAAAVFGKAVERDGGGDGDGDGEAVDMVGTNPMHVRGHVRSATSLTAAGGGSAGGGLKKRNSVNM